MILAGGKGTRLWPDTESVPKPMVTVGGMPILWHIMRCYQAAGVDDFIICAGHLGRTITRWFIERSAFSAGSAGHLCFQDIDGFLHWDRLQVQVVPTGDDAQTATRLQRVRHLLGDEPFHLAYGDGLSDLDLGAPAKFLAHQPLYHAVMTVVHPPSRFGIAEMDHAAAAQPGGCVERFEEKPRDPRWANGGFFVLHPAALGALDPGRDEAWEDGPLQRLAARGRLAGWRHEGFWACMDAPRDRQQLEELYAQGDAPWTRNWPKE